MAKRVAVLAVNPVNGLGLFQYLESFYENQIIYRVYAVFWFTVWVRLFRAAVSALVARAASTLALSALKSVRWTWSVGCH